MVKIALTIGKKKRPVSHCWHIVPDPMARSFLKILMRPQPPPLMGRDRSIHCTVGGGLGGREASTLATPHRGCVSAGAPAGAGFPTKGDNQPQEREGGPAVQTSHQNSERLSWPAVPRQGLVSSPLCQDS